MSNARVLGWLLAASLVACGAEARGDVTPEAAVPVALVRDGPFGALRDFVLIERTELGPREALFVDRFETTQDDWRQFAESAAGRLVGAGQLRLPGLSSLPAAGMQHHQARAFAHWRLGRLPSVAEWQLVAIGDGRTLFPWGRRQDATRANTGDLAFGEATPVGTFESGRRAGRDAPYDLVGNVREWTDSVPVGWCEASLDLPLSASRCRARAAANPALAVWQQAGLMPAGVLAAAGGENVPRMVVGGDFETPMTELYAQQIGSEQRQRTGVRVYATAGELLDRLLHMQRPASDTERALLVGFIRRSNHREVLLRALDGETILREVTAGSVADLLLRTLRANPGDGR